jgi:hypothetical protein
MKRQRKFRPFLTGLEQRLNLNAGAGHVAELGASAVHAAVASKVHHTQHHKPAGHHSGGHAKVVVMGTAHRDHKTPHPKPHHKPTTHKH